MGQPQRIVLEEPECDVKLTSDELGILIAEVKDLIDSGEKDLAFGCEDPTLQEDIDGLKVLRHKLERALERG